MKKYTYGFIYKNIEDTITNDGDKYKAIQEFCYKHNLNHKKGFKSWDVICELISVDDKNVVHIATT